MKNIFSLLMALTILAGANAGERLTLSRKPFFTKAPITVVADKAPAQLAGTTIDIVCDSVHIYEYEQCLWHSYYANHKRKRQL